MGFGKFGSRPRGMNNPIYWVNRYRQDERSRSHQTTNYEQHRASQQLAVEQFNKIWHGLIEIHKQIITDYIEPLNGCYIEQSIALELIRHSSNAVELRELINTKLARVDGYVLLEPELEKYATSIEELTLLVRKLRAE